MAFSYFEIGISTIIIFLYIFALYLLLKLRVSLAGEFSETIVYFRIAVFTLFALRIQTVLGRANLILIPYLQDVLAFFLAVFLLLAFNSFYNSINSVSRNKSKKKNPFNSRGIKWR